MPNPPNIPPNLSLADEAEVAFGGPPTVTPGDPDAEQRELDCPCGDEGGH